MEANWSEKLKNFDRVWQRVSKQRAGAKQPQRPLMPKNCPQHRNTRFHGGGK